MGANCNTYYGNLTSERKRLRRAMNSFSWSVTSILSKSSNSCFLLLGWCLPVFYWLDVCRTQVDIRLALDGDSCRYLTNFKPHNINLALILKDAFAMTTCDCEALITCTC